jgi:hypothetical protein
MEGDAGPVRLWRLPSGQPIGSVLGPDDRIVRASLSGSRLGVVQRAGAAGHDYRLRIFDLPTGAAVADLPVTHPGGGYWAFHPGGRLMAYTTHEGGEPQAVWLDLGTGRRIRVLHGLAGQVAFSPDGTWFGAAAALSIEGRPHGAVRVWEVATGREQFVADLPGQLAAFGFSPDGAQLLIFASRDGVEIEHRVVDVADGRERLRLPATAGYGTFAADGTLVLESWWTGGAWLIWFDTTTGRERGRRRLGYAWRRGSVSAATPDGRYLESSAHVDVNGPFHRFLEYVPMLRGRLGPPPKQVLELREGVTGELVARWDGAHQVEYSPDTGLAVTVEVQLPDNVYQVWDAPPRKPLTWYLPLAAALALPPAWLARRRVARLRIAPPPSG